MFPFGKIYCQNFVNTNGKAIRITETVIIFNVSKEISIEMLQSFFVFLAKIR